MLKSYVSGFPFVKSANFIKINDRIHFIKAIKSLEKKKKSFVAQVAAKNEGHQQGFGPGGTQGLKGAYLEMHDYKHGNEEAGDEEAELQTART